MNIPRLERTLTNPEMGLLFRLHEKFSARDPQGSRRYFHRAFGQQKSRAGRPARLLLSLAGGYFVWKRATDMNLTALPVKRLTSATSLLGWKPAV